ncbi:MAG TPA: alpha/beta fold hydrolase [Chloroflexi bacterium]|nr:alpha/beta fold hydrolase [Chloroflexota bacterium]
MINDYLVNPHLDGDSFLWEAGPTGVLLLHGLTATTAEVRLLAADLLAQGYTVMGPLLPGHGAKPEDLNEVTWQDWAWTAVAGYQHLATLCDHVFVGGESTGAALALHLAEHHQEISGVLCYAPAIKLAMPIHKKMQLYASAPFIEAIPKAGADDNAHWQGYKVNPLRSVQELIALGRVVRRDLGKITQPVLVVQGRHDETVAPDAGQIILDNVQSDLKEMVWLEESGHIVLLEDERGAITQLTRRFMEQALASNGS